MLELSYCFLARFTFFRDIGKFEHALGWGKEEKETENGKVEKNIPSNSNVNVIHNILNYMPLLLFTITCNFKRNNIRNYLI